jgi:type I pantothenate kinase
VGRPGLDLSALVELLFVPAGECLAPRPADPDDTAGVYAPLARWIGRRRDAGAEPLIVGVAGGVAAGKTTLAGRLAELLAAGPSSPRVLVVATDGFLRPNAELSAMGLATRKGFPESYDAAALIEALATLKARRPATIPTYSHLTYDVEPGRPVEPADVIVVEGINVLQLPTGGLPLAPSDLLDVAIYLDAAEADLRRWFEERLVALFDAARGEPSSFYHQWSGWEASEIGRFADAVWQEINLPNLRDHIAPSRLRADVVVTHDGDHRVRTVLTRRR